MYGVTFNEKHSFNDFGLFVMGKSIQPPGKKKIKVDVPGMSGNYDFSTVASNGEIVYNTREIIIKFAVDAINVKQLFVKCSKILEWLQDCGQQKLIFDDISDYYFIAEVEAIPTLQQIIMFGELEVKFVADPFRTSIDYVGDIWDTFNFEEDIVQDVEFDVVGAKTVSIYNAGRLITPIIVCNARMDISIGGGIYSLAIGDNKVYGLNFKNGYNSIDISGTGSIYFKFKKVRI